MKFVCAAVAALLACPPGVWAQPPAPGRVQGQVLDTTGQPLPGVSVELEAPGAASIVALTAADGRYTAAAVPAGVYQARFSLVSFVTLLRRNVTVTAGAATTADATLYVAATASVVVSGRSTFRNLSTVSGQDELIGVADAASTGVITPLELNERA
ncbi:MAG: carboxypeptidase regulatory-like domain-containing protein, partial [Acidobacteria bacterium]|nr:carboxypeptidase regulatory-like domain-containing protein [Acidobacteriota bacterium]